jgi:hypothetical protein
MDRSKRKHLFINIQFGGPLSNPTGRLNEEKYFSLDYKHLAPVIELLQKKCSLSPVFEVVNQKLLCLIFKLEVGGQSYREIALLKIF